MEVMIIMNTVIMMTMLMILGRLVIRGLFTHVYTMSAMRGWGKPKER